MNKDWTTILNLALNSLGSIVTLVNNLINTAEQSGEMSSEERDAWLKERDAKLAQPWHKVDPDPE